jgi:hypothetical protein
MTDRGIRNHVEVAKTCLNTNPEFARNKVTYMKDGG